ncbi:probable ATP-dependent RNA helicase DDX43 [Agrilus planipennis]|uniref:RNA helicase n=1 Tax=Agrilus planipennis TaxID=224129 RepID=A0A1W4WFZ5_AGRPL|nr:probable ATP-dependent RNA helicase DDX43 [Agrilus planipennis]
MSDGWDDSWNNAKPFNDNQGNHDKYYRNSNFRRGAPRDKQNRNYDRKPRNSNPTTTIQVPTNMVGRIIGRGGSKISDLQFNSGANIKVTKNTEGMNTMVEITGSEEAIKRATEMIEDLTKERPPPATLTSESHDNSCKEMPPIQIDWKALAEESERYQKEQFDKLPPIKKNFYKEDPEVTNMSNKEVEAFRAANNNIVVSRMYKQGEKEKIPIPNPVTTFEQAFRDYPEILEEIAKQGFQHPSPIQSQAWPVLLSGDDLIGIAQTGTGKTLAFLLPALIHIEGQPVPREERMGPSVLVMAPTRELALQIDKEVKKYYYKGIKALCVYGGGNRREQINTLNTGVDVIIATPGRLNDLVEAGHISVKSITYVVLDEADRMLDMGFEPQIRKVLYDIRPDRQTVMTSATWPIGVRRLADSYMINPVQVYVGTLDLAACHSVTQHIVLLDDTEEAKFETVLDFVANMSPEEKAIIFCGKKARADYLASELALRGFECQAIHGDREQVDREQALADITDGTVQILIATDVASRGLDIEDISHVINYDFPRNIEEYVHRVGRTGRAGRTGCSISYFTRADWASAKDLIPILEEANQYVPEEIFEMSKRYEAWRERKDQERARDGGGRRGGGRGGGRFHDGW